MKRIVLCADDYGQNSGISTAILTLARHGRLSATSCMSAARNWPAAARQLRASGVEIDVGLHFTLIGEGYLDGAALGGATRARSVGQLIGSSYLRLIRKEAVIAALHRQLDLFQQHLGREPDFIDGHQHIHQLPVIRAALLEVYRQRFARQRPYIRSLAHIKASGHAGIKPQIIKALGARPLQQRLQRQQISHNRDFGGIYDFSPQHDYAALMRYWLGHARDGALLMCHPGLDEDSAGSDPIAAARINEYRYLGSDEFLADCHTAGVQLVRGDAAGW